MKASFKPNLKSSFIEVLFISSVLAIYLTFKDITSGTSFGIMTGVSAFLFIMMFNMYLINFAIRCVFARYTNASSSNWLYVLALPLIFVGVISLSVYFIAFFKGYSYTSGIKPALWSLGISLSLALLDLVKNKGEASRDFFSMFSIKES